MKYLEVLIVVALALGLAAAFVGCKKKEEVPTAETAAETAAVAEEEVACPAPGEDLICEECKELFISDEDYAAHMETKHPEKWAKVKDKFWEMRETEGGE